MLESVLAYLHNYFPIIGEECTGDFTIEGGAIILSCVSTRQYYHISGSKFNDGVHQYPYDDLVDETFTGVITPLAIPAALLSVVAEMEEWETANSATMLSPFESESFGGYSYSKKSGSNGKALTVFDVFAAKLGRWKKI